MKKMNKTHRLKCWKKPFEDIISGRKPFELRNNDRDFQVDDTLILDEWDTEKVDYTGRQCTVKVTYTLFEFGLKSGWIAMAIKHLPEPMQATIDQEKRD